MAFTFMELLEFHKANKERKKKVYLRLLLGFMLFPNS